MESRKIICRLSAVAWAFLFGMLCDCTLAQDSTDWVVEPSSSETELTLPPFPKMQAQYESLFIHKAVPSNDGRFLFLVMHSRSSNFQGLTRTRWSIVSWPLSGEAATTFRVRKDTKLLGLEPFRDSQILCTAKNGELPEEYWKYDPKAKSAELFDIGSLHGSSENLPLPTRLIVNEIADELQVENLSLATIPTEIYGRRFFGHDGELAQRMVSRGIAANQVLFVRNDPFGIECWNVQEGNLAWQIGADDLSKHFPDALLSNNVSCWIPASVRSGQTEIPVVLRTPSRTLIAAIDQHGNLRIICQSEIDYPCGSPLMASRVQLLALCYSRDRPKPHMLMSLCSYDLETSMLREQSRHMSQVIFASENVVYCHSRVAMFRVPLDNLSDSKILWPTSAK